MIQSAKVRQHDLQSKIAKIRGQLVAMREYKKLIAIDGIEPDADDKARESELIVRLLYLEKQLNGPKKAPTKASSKNAAHKSSNNSKKFGDFGSKSGRSSFR